MEVGVRGRALVESVHKRKQGPDAGSVGNGLAVVIVFVLAMASRGLAAADDVLPAAGSTGEIRVCLTDDPIESSILLTTTEETKVVATGSTKVLHRSPARSELRIQRQAGAWLVAGKKSTAETIEVQPVRSPGVWVNGRLYRGKLKLLGFNNRSFWVINILPLEHYLCSVVDGEVPGTFENEARKAQAVAARTYAMRRRDQAGDKGFDVYASPVRDQNYQGFQYRDAKGRALAGESAKSRRAVRETAGQVLMRDGKLARTYYSACCGGVTSEGTTTFPYATEMKSVECAHCQDCPRYRWTTKVGKEELTAAVRKAAGKTAPKGFEVASVVVDDRTNRQALPEVVAKDKAGKAVRIDSRSFRAGFSRSDLFSVWFSITKEGDQWRFDGIGHGHGVGLCQWGANGLAKEGRAFDEILRFYYPGADVAAYVP